MIKHRTVQFTVGQVGRGCQVESKSEGLQSGPCPSGPAVFSSIFCFLGGEKFGNFFILFRTLLDQGVTNIWIFEYFPIQIYVRIIFYNFLTRIYIFRYLFVSNFYIRHTLFQIKMEESSQRARYQPSSPWSSWPTLRLFRGWKTSSSSQPDNRAGEKQPK